MKLLIDTQIPIDEDGGMVVVAYMDDIIIATKGRSKSIISRFPNYFNYKWTTLCVEIDKCIFDAKEVRFL